MPRGNTDITNQCTIRWKNSPVPGSEYSRVMYLMYPAHDKTKKIISNKENWGLCWNPIFQSHSVILCSSYEGNSFSLIGGGSMRGASLCSPYFFGVLFSTLSRGYRNRGDARVAVAEERWAGAPKSDWLFLWGFQQSRILITCTNSTFHPLSTMRFWISACMNEVFKNPLNIAEAVAEHR